MADLSLGFTNPESLFPPSDAFNIGGIPSAYGQSVNMDKAEAAKQFLGEQLKRLPLASQVEQGELQNKLQLQPQQLEVNKQKLKNEYSQLQGQPVGELVDNLADSYNSVEDASPEEQGKTYNSVVQQWKQKHPGMQLPPEVENFDPKTTPQHWQDAYNMKRYSVDEQKQFALKKMEKEQEIEKARIAAEANIKAQRGRGVEAEALRNHNDKKNEQRIANLKKQVLSKDLDDETRSVLYRELESLVMPKFEDDSYKRFGNETDRAMLSEKKQNDIEQKVRKARNEYMDSHGLRMKVTDKSGRVITIKRSDYPAAKEQGFKETK